MNINEKILSFSKKYAEKHPILSETIQKIANDPTGAISKLGTVVASAASIAFIGGGLAMVGADHAGNHQLAADVARASAAALLAAPAGAALSVLAKPVKDLVEHVKQAIRGEKPAVENQRLANATTGRTTLKALEAKTELGRTLKPKI